MDAMRRAIFGTDDPEDDDIEERSERDSSEIATAGIRYVPDSQGMPRP
jgi:hypothetical protein